MFKSMFKNITVIFGLGYLLILSTNAFATLDEFKQNINARIANIDNFDENIQDLLFNPNAFITSAGKANPRNSLNDIFHTIARIRSGNAIQALALLLDEYDSVMEINFKFNNKSLLLVSLENQQWGIAAKLLYAKHAIIYIDELDLIRKYASSSPLFASRFKPYFDNARKAHNKREFKKKQDIVDRQIKKQIIKSFPVHNETGWPIKLIYKLTLKRNTADHSLRNTPDITGTLTIPTGGITTLEMPYNMFWYGRFELRSEFNTMPIEIYKGVAGVFVRKAKINKKICNGNITEDLLSLISLYVNPLCYDSRSTGTSIFGYNFTRRNAHFYVRKEPCTSYVNNPINNYHGMVKINQQAEWLIILKEQVLPKMKDDKEIEEIKANLRKLIKDGTFQLMFPNVDVSSMDLDFLGHDFNK